MKEIQVAVCSDDFYAPFVSTTITSILMHTSRKVHFYVLADGITQYNKNKIAQGVRKSGKYATVEFIDVTDMLDCIPDGVGHISRVAVSRFFIPNLIHEKKVIYTDIDVVFTNDIGQLWDEDIDGFAFAAVPSQRTRITDNYAHSRRKYGISSKHVIFMDGLLIIDCRKWRKDDYGKRLLELVVDKQVLDQEAMNIFFDGVRYKTLDAKYCVIYKLFGTCYSIDETEKLRKEQVIVHYPGSGESKPWYSPDIPSARFFWRVVKRSPYSSIIQTRYGINTVEDLVELSRKHENIIVYGAGIIGQLVLKAVNREEYGLDKVFVAVTNKDNNPEQILEHKVQSIEDFLAIKDNALVIVAVDVSNARNVEKTIVGYGFNNYVVVTRALKRAIERESTYKYDESALEQLFNSINDRINALFALFDYSVDIRLIPQARGELRELQFADVLLLRLFDLFCKKNDLSYWLIGGTLLGAVRHKGFVPWDDDLDVSMSRDSYDRLDDVFDKDLKRYGFELNKGKGYYHQVKRIIYKDSSIQLDMWPFDGLKEFDGDYELLKTKMIKCHREFYEEVDVNDLREGKKTMPRNKLMELETRIVGELCDVENARVLFEGCEVCPEGGPYLFTKTDIFPLQRIEFEGLGLNAPHNPERVCETLFGDYLAFPQNKVLGHANINMNKGYDYKESIMELSKIVHDYEQIY